MASLLLSILALGALEITALCGLFALFTGLTALYFVTIRYPSNLPRVRERKGATRFSLTTRLAYFTNCKSLYEEAYEKYLKHGKACLIPGLGFHDDLVIPPSSIRWLSSQSDSVLSSVEGVLEIDQVEYNIGTKYVTDCYPAMYVKRDMTANAERIAMSIADELKPAFDARFGSCTDIWKEVNVLNSMKLVVAQYSSRFTVGLPLCRNEQYLIESNRNADLFIITSGIVGVMPKILRPVIGKMSAIPLSYRLNKMKRELKPIFQQRMELLKESQNEDEPRDLLQTMLRFAQAERPAELNLDDVAIRLNLMNLGTFHQTSIATTNILFNIVASDKEYNTISILRKEFTTVLAAHDNTWSKAAIAQMTKADSICRETLRINAFGHRSVFKKVMVDNLRTEDGILLPKGAFLSMLHYPIHHDGDLFEDPFKFDPFRFSRIREASEDPKAAANLAFTATGPQFLPFGHGRHSCPGRWFLDFELKMMIAYIVLNYDLELPVEYGGKRPANTWLAEATLPPIEGRLRIRRRKDNSV